MIFKGRKLHVVMSLLIKYDDRVKINVFDFMNEKYIYNIKMDVNNI